MLLRRVIYLLLFALLIWIALATRRHAEWFHPVIAKYGGDVIWAGAFLFLLRIIFIKASIWKVAVWCYLLSVLDEVSQLIHNPLFDTIRSTTIGRLMFGVGFVWSDLICYAAGTFLAWVTITLIESYPATKKKAAHPAAE